VNGASLSAPLGRITGLIGPNGAGKTTFFNACTGLARPSRGTVVLDGRDVSSLGPAARARLGLARTFQHTELWASMTVRQNVAMGAEAALAGRGVLRELVGTQVERRQVERSTAAALELAGLEPLADMPLSQATTGQRRLAEFARAYASGGKLLLLDEPSAGLDASETRAFGGMLMRTASDQGVGVLLVEHDMSLVMSVCAYIYVLDFGQLIFEGTPAEVSASPAVRAAYLGTGLDGTSQQEMVGA
jgi:ABC-type branched-subunit amino acid transport system ATPase component